MSGRHTTVECEASVDVFELVDDLSDDEKTELAFRLLNKRGEFDRSGDKTVAQLVEQLAIAIERRDCSAAESALHTLCMDVAGRPVLNPISIGDWRRAAA